MTGATFGSAKVTMRLSSFEISNYRAFSAPAHVELRELTLFFGYNNVGKSALARVLPLLRDSVSGQPGLPLNLESEVVRGGELEDLRSRHTRKRQMELTLSWQDTPLQRLQLTLQDLPDRRLHVVESFEANGPAGALRGTWDSTSSPQPGDTKYELKLGEQALGHHRIAWRGLVPLLGEPQPLEAAQTFADIASALLSLQNVHWLGAVRTPQPRRFRLPRQRPVRLAADGRGAGEALAWSESLKEPVFSKVAQWYADKAKAPLQLAKHGEEYALELGASAVNLGDTGEGFTQVLPVLTAGAMAEHGAGQGQASYLVVEQPELHLHPGLHAPLAEYFCALAMAEAPPRICIETHSENFLFGVQLAVARGDLAPERVAIYWVEQEDGINASLCRIGLDGSGRLDSWPHEVFAEDTLLARELLQVRRGRSAI
jgi:AAA ATPase domain